MLEDVLALSGVIAREILSLLEFLFGDDSWVAIFLTTPSIFSLLVASGGEQPVLLFLYFLLNGGLWSLSKTSSLLLEPNSNVLLVEVNSPSVSVVEVENFDLQAIFLV